MKNYAQHRMNKVYGSALHVIEPTYVYLTWLMDRTVIWILLTYNTSASHRVKIVLYMPRLLRINTQSRYLSSNGLLG